MPVPTGTVSATINGFPGTTLGPVDLDGSGDAALSGTVSPALAPSNYTAEVTYSGGNYPPTNATIPFTVGGVATITGTATYDDTTNTLNINVSVTGS